MGRHTVRTALKMFLHETSSSFAFTFSPLQIPSLEAWWDFSEPSNLYQDDAGATPVTASGQSIGRAVDKVNGHAAIQATGTKKPTYTTGEQNGDPAAVLDGGDHLKVAFGTSFSQPNTILIVAEFLAVSDAAIDGDDGTNRHVIYVSASGDMQMFSGVNLVSGSTRTNNYRLITCRFNGTTSRMRVDGKQGSTGNAGTQSIDGITIGAFNDDTLNLLGGIKHVLVFSDNLTPNQLADLENYFVEDTAITGYSDHKFQYGGDNAWASAFCPLDRNFWRFGGDQTNQTVIQWFNIDTNISGSSTKTIANSGGACVWHPGKKLFYIYGGRVNGTWPCSSAVYSFDPITDTLTLLTETLTGTLAQSSAAYYPGDGKVYIFGGIISSALTTTTTIQVHDPVAGTITDTTADLPVANAAMGIAYAPDVGLIFLLGGYASGGGSSIDSVVTYNPATPTTNAVDTGENLTVALENPATAYVSGRLYALGGYTITGTIYRDIIHKIVTNPISVSAITETCHKNDDDATAFYDPVTRKVWAGPFVHSTQGDNDPVSKKIVYEFDPSTETLAAEPSLT